MPVYNEAKKQALGVFLGPVNLSGLKCMLVDTTYVFNPDLTAIDDGTAADPASHEIATGGYARQTLTGGVVGKDLTGDFGYLDFDDAVFPSLATGATIGGAVIYWPGASDALSIPVSFYDVADTPTNGSSVTIQFASAAAGAAIKAA